MSDPPPHALPTPSAPTPTPPDTPPLTSESSSPSLKHSRLASSHWYHRGLGGWQPSFYCVIPIIWMEAVVMIIATPSLPDMLQDFFDNSYSKSSLYKGIVDGSGAFVSFLVAPLIGAASDQYGRKSVMIFVMMTSSIPAIMLACRPYISLWFYLGAKVIGSLQSLGMVMTYSSDITAPARRTKIFGYIMANSFAAICIIPFSNLVLDELWSLRVGGMAAIVNILYVFLFLPESYHLAGTFTDPIDILPPTHDDMVTPLIDDDVVTDIPQHMVYVENEERGLQQGFQPSHQQVEERPLVLRPPSLNPFVSLRYIFRSKLYLTVCSVVFFSQLSENGLIETALLYLKRQLHFNRTDNMYTIVAMGFMGATCLFLILPLMLRRYTERTVVIVAVAANAIHIAMYALIWEKWQVYVIAIFTAISFMAFAGNTALLSKNVPAHEQGIALGALAGIRALTQGLGPLLFSLLFSYFTSDKAPIDLPSAPFWLGLLCCIIALIIAFQLPKGRGKYDQKISTMVH